MDSSTSRGIQYLIIVYVLFSFVRDKLMAGYFWCLSTAIVLVPLVLYFVRPSRSSIPNATPQLPLTGNAVSYGIDPVKFLAGQRARHGDVFRVNLVIIRIVFLLGPEGTNALLKGTEKSGISFYSALSFLIGSAVDKGNLARHGTNRRPCIARMGREFPSKHAKNPFCL